MALEGLLFDTIDLNGTAWQLESIEMPPPAKRVEWAQGADADGASLVRDPLFENRTVTLRLWLAQQVDMNTAIGVVAALSKKIEECEKQPNGLPLVWTPAGATSSVTFYVLTGAIMDLPISLTGDDVGWFQRAPHVTLQLTCKPFGYGTQVVGGATSSSGQFVSLTLAGVPGDAPAEGRLIVTDTATQDRRYVEWGLEQRYYNGAALQITPTVTGFGGSSSTRSGSVNTNVARGALLAEPYAIAGLGTRSHVGTYRVKARAFASSTLIAVRLAYGAVGGQLHRNTFVAPPTANQWVELDLGLISVDPVVLGTQSWTGQIEAYGGATAGSTTGTLGSGGTLDLDYVLLIPVHEGYGRARTPNVPQPPSVFVGQDTFPTAGALNGQSMLIGGAWATSGDATDFTVASSMAQRSEVSDADINTGRYAIAGTTASTNILVQADIQTSNSLATGVTLGVIARYTDANNWLMAQVRASALGTGNYVEIKKRVAGTVTSLGTFTPSGGIAAGVWSTLALTVDTAGRWTVTQDTNVIGTGIDTALATGGALASGKSGFYDANTTTTVVTRSYRNFSACIPVINNTLYSGRALEFRHDGVIQQDSTGTYYGPVPTYRGSRFLIPPAGDANRTSRVVVKAHRNNIEYADAENVTDGLSASVTYTPRYLVVPA